ncbi:nitroreductase family protein [Solicola gregarius]|uniref:Nitroreductase family protein n=1 Tax=Solicola gregarius TaxID=2908642 RepID=A0AA46TJJ5_9ACTN|nr:nitroreductase family protein [Solicola gregarius]UYM05648.1 nitroreductase family protein [Solicola gregarius]
MTADGTPPLSELHDLLRTRFSPLAFDPRHSLSSAEVDLLLEAARWAPSAGNSQPWAFVAERRGEPAHAQLVRHLAGSSRRWASSASVLIVNISHRFVDDTTMEYSEFADYDLGQAVAHLTLQAQAMGLACRQFRAFDLPALSEELSVSPGWFIVSMVAVGVPAGPGAPQRDRRTLRSLVTAPFTDGDDDV